MAKKSFDPDESLNWSGHLGAEPDPECKPVDVWGFEIPGPLMGYRQATRRSLWTKENRKYGAWKGMVLALAMQEGFRTSDTSRENAYRLHVSVFWKGAPRIDWKNVYGAIEDALWTRDRYVRPGMMNDWWLDTGRECAVVRVERLSGR